MNIENLLVGELQVNTAKNMEAGQSSLFSERCVVGESRSGIGRSTLSLYVGIRPFSVSRAFAGMGNGFDSMSTGRNPLWIKEMFDC